MRKNLFITPFILPLAGFAAAILLGSLLLWMDFTQARPALDGLAAAGSAVYPVSYWDALYTATSAVCVTGLAALEPSVAWNGLGQGVIMLLMQLGGLGIITYSSLIFFMITRRVRLLDRLAVGQALLHDSRFHLGNFVRRVVVLVLLLEAWGCWRCT